jgi:hypothetical protein
LRCFWASGWSTSSTRLGDVREQAASLLARRRQHADAGDDVADGGFRLLTNGSDNPVKAANGDMLGVMFLRWLLGIGLSLTKTGRAGCKALEGL